MDLKIDKSTIKALSNDTRVDILKKLNSRRYTQSELASLLHLSVPTIKEHLDSLISSELVTKVDEGRKWKYFALTKKARNILEPEKVNLFIVLSTTVLSAVGVVASLLRKPLTPPMAQRSALMVAESNVAADAAVEGGSFGAKVAASANGMPVASEPSFLFVFSLVLFIFSILAATYFYVRRINTKKKVGVL